MEIISAVDLMARTFPPGRFIIPGILPAGLTLLAGRPKIGKSWLALGMSLGVSSGDDVLGRPVDAGRVLHLALEDGPRRLKDRLGRMLGGRLPSKRLDFVTQIAPLDAGGTEAIRKWIETAPEPRLVVVDVFERVRPKGDRSGRLYQDDYASVLPLKKIADDYGVAVVAVTHTRKSDAELDPLDAVSATTGLTGAADNVLILARGPEGAAIYGRGRDVEEIDLALRFEGARGLWRALGDREDVNRSDIRNAILKVLRAAVEPLGPAEIAKQAGADPGNVRVRLGAMVSAGEIEKIGRGLYSTPVTPDTLDTFPSLSESNDSYECNGGERVPRPRAKTAQRVSDAMRPETAS
ncbi:recombinase A [Kaistia algarum]|uniref:AAA family ATPase n=1 Tax=Kaistia algarum TaxID=2083279 RepID=UPI000CE88B54|nr:AAA family ATPase [Kaistia algarum]MCX5513367.1 AAA family ATPase [Kaistia algarum]PPE81184.1 recombinase A [Kaistia algarum]